VLFVVVIGVQQMMAWQPATASNNVADSGCCSHGVLQLPAAMMLPDMYNASDQLAPYWRSLPPKESLLSIYNIPPAYIPMLQAAGPVSNSQGV
jgi:hypothetical protein